VTSSAPKADPDRTLQLVHRGTLGALAACAAVIAGFTELNQNTPTATPFAVAAITLGIGAVISRQRANGTRSNPETRLRSMIICFACAAGIGGVAVGLVATEGHRQVALFYTLAGAILALRPAPPIPRNTDGDVA
jgi:peptidoglycan/LPS O-acetylase OafA/YrhL